MAVTYSISFDAIGRAIKSIRHVSL